MFIQQENIQCSGIKLILRDNDNYIIGRAFVYIMQNDLHKAPFALLEDLYIEKAFRRQGLASYLINEIIKIAKEKGCYKLIANSRYSRFQVHNFYKSLGFKDYGKEFRINL